MITSHQSEILGQRAAELAQADLSGESEASSQGAIACLVVYVDPNRYAFQLTDVTEVMRLDQLTFIPGYPPFIAGIFPYRGMVLTALDLRKFLGVPAPGITQLDRVVVLHDRTKSMGILIDRVDGVEMINPDSLQLDITGIGNDLQKVTWGVAAAGYAVLDATKLFAEPRLAAMSRNANSSTSAE